MVLAVSALVASALAVPARAEDAAAPVVAVPGPQPAVARRWEEAEQARRDGDHARALAHYQALLAVADAAPLPGAIELTPGFFVPLDDACLRRIAALDAAALRAYRAAADGALAEALRRDEAAADPRARDPRRGLLAHAVRRAWPATDGARALARLGDRAFEAGDFAAAREWSRRLVEDCPGDPPERAAALLRLAASARALGGTAELRRLARAHGDEALARALAEGDETLTLEAALERWAGRGTGDGRRAAGGTSGFELQAPPAPSAVEGDQARAPPALTPASGPPTGRAVLSKHPAPRTFEPALPRWHRPDDTHPWPPAAVQRCAARGLPVVPRATAQATAHAVYLAARDSLTALEPATGALRWRFPAEPEWTLPEYPDLRRPHVAVQDGRVFAVVRGGLTCFDDATGRLRWRLSAHALGAALEARLAAAFAGERPALVLRELSNPLAAGGQLYVAVALRDVETLVVLCALAPDDGRLRWVTPVAAGAAPRLFDAQFAPGDPIWADGAVVVPSNLGLVAAVDATDGRLCWGRRDGRRAAGPVVAGLRERVALPPAQAAASSTQVLVAESGGSRIIALDRADGRFLWSAPRAVADELVGIADGRAWVLGARLRAYLLDGGRLVADEALPGGAPTGQAALTDGLIVYADEQHLRVFDTRASGAEGQASGFGPQASGQEGADWIPKPEAWSLEPEASKRWRRPFRLPPENGRFPAAPWRAHVRVACDPPAGEGGGRVYLAGLNSLLALDDYGDGEVPSSEGRASLPASRGPDRTAPALRFAPGEVRAPTGEPRRPPGATRNSEPATRNSELATHHATDWGRRLLALAGREEFDALAAWWDRAPDPALRALPEWRRVRAWAAEQQAAALRRTRRLVPARAELERALALLDEPADQARLTWELGLINEALGEPALAEARWWELLRRFPREPLVFPPPGAAAQPPPAGYGPPAGAPVPHAAARRGAPPVLAVPAGAAAAVKLGSERGRAEPPAALAALPDAPAWRAVARLLIEGPSVAPAERSPGPADPTFALAQAWAQLAARPAAPDEARVLLAGACADRPGPFFAQDPATLLLTTWRREGARRRPAVFEAYRFHEPPVIDGVLDDGWIAAAAVDRETLDAIEFAGRQLPDGRRVEGEAPARWEGPPDLSVVFYFGWDERHLYLAAVVQDEHHLPFDFDSDDLHGDVIMTHVDRARDAGGREYVNRLGARQLFGHRAPRAAGAQGPEPDQDRADRETALRRDPATLTTVSEMRLALTPELMAAADGSRDGPRLGAGGELRINVVVLDDDGAGVMKYAGLTPGYFLQAFDWRRSFVPDVRLFGRLVLRDRPSRHGLACDER